MRRESHGPAWARARILTLVGAGALLGAALIAPGGSLAAGGDGDAGPTRLEASDDRLEGARLRDRDLLSLQQAARGGFDRMGAVVSALGSLDTDERLRALDQIAVLGRAEGVGDRLLDALLSGLESSDAYRIRYTLLALGRLGDRRAATALEGLVLAPRTTAPDRFYALGTLARLGSSSSLPLFWSALDDPQPGLRRVAEIGLLEGLGTELLPGLLERLDEAASSARMRETCRGLIRRLRDESRQGLDPSDLDTGGGAVGSSGLQDDRALRDWARAASKRGHDPRPHPPLLRRIGGAEVVIETDVSDDTRVRLLALELGRFRRGLSWCFERRAGRVAEPVHVKLFSDRRDFERYGATHDYNFQFFNEFYYSFLLREVVAFDLPDDEKRLSRRLQHEVCHDYFERAIGAPPVWFNEGVAEVLEVAHLDAHGVLVLERNPEWDPRLIEARREGGMPTLRELLSLTPERFYAEDAPRAYAAAWSFADFLLRGHGEAGRAVLQRVFEALRARRPAKVPALLLSVENGQLESQWRDRVARETHP